MIRLEGAELSAPPLAYVRNSDGLRSLALRVTRSMRAANAARYMTRVGERHLDIGCGDGYFLRRSPCAEKIGLDRIYGDEIADRLDFPDRHFDYVTMLAVLDMLDEPRPLLQEISRVLKPDGRLIVTTPSPASDKLLRLYLGPSKERQTYIDAARMRALSQDWFEIAHRHAYLFGLNQVFCLVPRDA